MKVGSFSQRTRFDVPSGFDKQLPLTRVDLTKIVSELVIDTPVNLRKGSTCFRSVDRGTCPIKQALTRN
jgi:hypothetical protein